MIHILWVWETPEGSDIAIVRKKAKLFEEVRIRNRGQYRGITRRLTVEDVLGLCRVAFRVQEELAIDVLPHTGRLNRIPSLVSMSGGDELPHPMGIEDGDRLELQRYMAGDPARFIHWKVFGRTRRLMIRSPERALSLSHRTGAYIIAGSEDDASAAIARVAIERQLLGTDWYFGSDEDPFGTSECDEALSILMRSTKGKEKGGVGLKSYFEQIEKQGPVSAMVFIPPTYGPWMNYLQNLAKTRKVHVVIGTDGIKAPHPETWWSKLIVFRHEERSLSPEHLYTVIQALQQANCHISIFDRSKGEAIGERHIQSIQELTQSR